jgi:hypothetical protein
MHYEPGTSVAGAIAASPLLQAVLSCGDSTAVFGMTARAATPVGDLPHPCTGLNGQCADTTGRDHWCSTTSADLTAGLPGTSLLSAVLMDVADGTGHDYVLSISGSGDAELRVGNIDVFLGELDQLRSRVAAWRNHLTGVDGAE